MTDPERESAVERTSAPDPAGVHAPACRILAFAPNTWEGQWMNRQHLLTRLARWHQVLYTNGPWSLWHRDKPDFEVAPWLGDFQRHDGVLVDLPSKLLLTWPTVPAWDRLVRRLVVRRWKHRLAAMGNGPLIAYVFHPMYASYAEMVGADMVVYHPYDLFSQTPEWTAEAAASEDGLLARCTFAVVSSKPSRDALQKRTQRPVFYVPNGVDSELFIRCADQPSPPDLAAIPRPRVGYVGSLNRKVDFGMIAELATREPSWNFVLMGPPGNMDDVSRSALERCRSLANVHLLGPRSVPELPAYMGGLDVGLMCYRRDTWMDFGYPLKLHEYFAAGLPVVSTPLPSIREFDRFLDLATTSEEWHGAIGRCLRQGKTPQKVHELREVARRNNWDLRVANLQDLLLSALQSAGSPLPVPAASAP